MEENGVRATRINKVLEGRPHVVDAIKNGDVQLVFNTTEGAGALSDSRSLRRAALLHKVPYYTTLAGAIAAAEGIKAYLGGDLEVRALQEYSHLKRRISVELRSFLEVFVDREGAGNGGLTSFFGRDERWTRFL